jgi:hypothetical protein
MPPSLNITYKTFTILGQLASFTIVCNICHGYSAIVILIKRPHVNIMEYQFSSIELVYYSAQ